MRSSPVMGSRGKASGTLENSGGFIGGLEGNGLSALPDLAAAVSCSATVGFIEGRSYIIGKRGSAIGVTNDGSSLYLPKARLSRHMVPINCLADCSPSRAAIARFVGNVYVLSAFSMNDVGSG